MGPKVTSYYLSIHLYYIAIPRDRARRSTRGFYPPALGPRGGPCTDVTAVVGTRDSLSEKTRERGRAEEASQNKIRARARTRETARRFVPKALRYLNLGVFLFCVRNCARICRRFPLSFSVSVSLSLAFSVPLETIESKRQR